MGRKYATRRRVEFGDTDMAGIMHFTNYFKLMESVETEFLNSLGLNVFWSDEHGTWGFPRVAASCEYFGPARFGDVLDITVEVVNVGNTSISYKFDFFRNTDHLAHGKITSVLCLKSADRGISSEKIPENIRRLLE